MPNNQAGYCLYCGKELKAKIIDAKERLVCTSEDCSFVYWNNPVPVCTAIIHHDSAILLVRNRGWPEKVFGLVTGFLEKDESPEEGIIREIKEELGLTGSIESFLGLYPFFQMNQLLIAYEVRASGEIALGDELEEVKKVSAEKLRPWPFGTGLIVRDWLEQNRQP